MNNTTFSSTVKDMWATRPARFPRSQGSKAQLVGVCEGIGVRYQIDPLLVRIVFIITSIAFGGGIAAYLLCWLLMPQIGKSTSPFDDLIHGNRTEGAERGKAIALLVALAFIITPGPIFSISPDAVISFTGLSLATYLLLFAGWYLLHRRTPQPPDFVAAAAPHWDPLAAAPDLWHLNEPNAHKSTWSAGKTWGVIAGAGSFILTIVLVTLFSVNILLNRPDSWHSAVSDIDTSFTNPADMPSHIENTTGDITLDLSQLQAPEQHQTLTVTNKVGDITITLPQDLPVSVSCFTRLGDTQCPTTSDANPLLTLNVRGGVGDVTVERP